jgi:hypothetical protein
MENNCLFVSSRGIAKSCSFYPKKIISDKDDNKSYLLDMLNATMFHGMSIYVISNLLSFFVNEILPKIKHKIILVTGASVKTCPIEVLNKNEFNHLITNKYLIKWCSQNNVISTFPKIKQIPLGLDYHTILNNSNHYWREQNEGILPIEQENVLLDLKKNISPFKDRICNKIFVNFEMKADRFKQRIESINKIPKYLLDIQKQKMKRTETWKTMTDYTFILSPYGNGMDCHRHWESIILGCIPIIKSEEFRDMFSDLPVLNVKDWSDINDKLLEETIEKFSKIHFNCDKLTLQYWKNIIFS